MNSYATLVTSIHIDLIFTVRIHKLGSAISHYQHILSLFPRSHPRRAVLVALLGLVTLEHYELSNDAEQLHKSILLVTEALLLPQPRAIDWPNTIQLLFSLARALYLRSI
jgi:catechol-2,3-dioxygenase